jgi:hypothetical protein
MKPSIDFIQTRWNLAATIFLIAGLGLLSACSSNFGVLRTDPEVTRTFKSRSPDPDYTYYYFRNPIHPIAIVGISKDYTLDSDVWTKVDESRVSLESLLERVLMSNKTLFYGARLISPTGEKMGVWFSPSSGATIKMRNENVIEYIRPWPPESVESDNRDGKRIVP